jgi:hypothetical protein
MSSQADPIESRAREALRKSDELIRQSNSLKSTVSALLRRLDDEAAIDGRRSVKGHAPVRSGSMLQWTIDSSLQATDATKANLQILDPASGRLHIAAQHGFSQAFLDFFDSVAAGEAACGTAFETRSRVFVEDVTESPIFHGMPALEVLLDAGVRAVQSTPLVSSSGMILGVLSAHWPSPGHLSNRALVSLDVLAVVVARWLEHSTCL